MGLIVAVIESKEVKDEFKVLCYQNIAEIADFFYEEYADYMQKITELSQEDIFSEEEALAIAVTQMWNQFTLCELALLQKNINVGLVAEFRTQIVPKMMMNLTKNDGIEEDDENMQNSLYSTSVVTLENINKLIGPAIEEINMEFMESKI